MKNLRLFGTESQYNIEAPSLEYPTISYITDSDTVKWMKKPGPHDYSEDYLTFEVLETCTFTLNIYETVDAEDLSSISYSVDDGETWITTQNSNQEINISTPTINAGNKILWKGIGNSYSHIFNASTGNFAHSKFVSTGRFNISGNIMSLLYGDNFNNQISFPNGSMANFLGLFSSGKVVSIENLIMPAITLTEFCYEQMFQNCQLLVTSLRILPATILTNSCYMRMFSSCTSLTNVPLLPATTLARSCYNLMFSNCTSLSNVPFNLLPATILEPYCYRMMFRGCPLTVAPELPATTLVDNCYQYMFQGCNNLNYIKAMFTTTPSTSYTNKWVNGVASTGTFVKNSSATWDVSGANGIPTGWTVETASE